MGASQGDVCSHGEVYQSHSTQSVVQEPSQWHQEAGRPEEGTKAHAERDGPQISSEFAICQKVERQGPWCGGRMSLITCQHTTCSLYDTTMMLSQDYIIKDYESSLLFPNLYHFKKK